MRELKNTMSVFVFLIAIVGFFQLAANREIIASNRAPFCCEDGDCGPAFQDTVKMCSNEAHIKSENNCTTVTETCGDCIDRESEETLCLLKESNEYCCLVDPSTYGGVCPDQYKYCVDLDFYIDGPGTLPPNQSGTWTAYKKCPTKSPYSYKWYRMVICPGGEKDYPCNKWYLVGTGSSLTLSSGSDFLLKLDLTDGRNHTCTDEKPVQISSLFKSAAEQTGLNSTAALTCYPNPLNSSVRINISLHKEADASVFIYNAKGQKVKTILNNRNMRAGEHTLLWDGLDDAGEIVPSGIYLCRMKSSESETVVRLSLLR